MQATKSKIPPSMMANWAKIKMIAINDDFNLMPDL